MRKPATSRHHKETAPVGDTCPFCSGSGACAKCDGAGKRFFRKGPLRVRRTVECAACNGTGRCDLCDGRGKVDSSGR